MIGHRRRAGAFALLSLLCLGSGLVLLFVPSVVPRSVIERVTTLETSVSRDLVIGVLVGVLTAFGLWRSYRSGATDVTDPLVNNETSAAHIDVVGASLTNRVDQTITALQHGHSSDTASVVDELRQTLHDIEVAKGRSSDRATERIQQGVWTDDTVAAVFLGTDPALTLSLWHRLRAWLFPARTFERRLERTLGELERYADRDERSATDDQSQQLQLNDGDPIEDEDTRGGAYG